MFARLQVCNLPGEFTKSELQGLFSKYEGNLYACFIVSDLNNPYLKQGFVQIETDDASKLIQDFEDLHIGGYRIEVTEADQRVWLTGLGRLDLVDRRRVYELSC